MVELIVGQKGKGKTKYLLDYVTKEIQSASGNIAYLDRNTKHMYELNNKIRLIDVTQYDVQNADEFIGFILGLLSQDNDLEQVFLDSFLVIACLEGKDLTSTLDRLSEISEKFKVKFVLSIGLDEKDIPERAGVKVIVSL